jgi:hypothetical protein
MAAGGIAPRILTSEQDGDKRLASLSARFTLGKLAHGIYWTEGWVDPKAGMDAVKKRKSLCPARIYCRFLGLLARSFI